MSYDVLSIQSDSSSGIKTKTSKTLEGFLQNVSGKKDTLKSVISDINAYGDLQEIEDLDVIVKSVCTALLTPKGSYFFDPSFGLGLHKYIFEPCDDFTKDSLQQEIRRILISYEDRAEIKSDVSFFKNKNGFQISLEFIYNGRTKYVKLNIDEEFIKTLDEENV